MFNWVNDWSNYYYWSRGDHYSDWFKEPYLGDYEGVVKPVVGQDLLLEIPLVFLGLAL